MNTGLPRARVAARALRRPRADHPWVFRDDVVEAPDATHGDLVEVVTPTGRVVGHAFFSAHSKITLRFVDRSPEPPADGHWRRRALDAVAYRREVVLGDTDAHRVLFGESDGIPGLVADRYGDHLVVQTLTAGAERILDEVLDGLQAAGIGTASVLARNDPAVRALEGLEREVRQLRGVTPERVTAREHGLTFAVDPWTGQKTGAYLDQRDNRHAASSWCQGEVLDAFAYHGSFALHAARSADHVLALDSSGPALERAKENARNNGLDNIDVLEANAFDALREFEQQGRRFHTVLLDPPAFARSRRDVTAARRGYREINLRAMRLLEDDGILVTSSCSYNLDESAFTELLAEAAADARRSFLVLERRTQAPCHPVRLGFPESQYLKCLVLRNRTA